jgi:hypothetical protein
LKWPSVGDPGAEWPAAGDPDPGWPTAGDPDRKWPGVTLTQWPAAGDPDAKWPSGGDPGSKWPLVTPSPSGRPWVTLFSRARRQTAAVVIDLYRNPAPARRCTTARCHRRFPGREVSAVAAGRPGPAGQTRIPQRVTLTAAWPQERGGTTKGLLVTLSSQGPEGRGRRPAARRME